MSGPSDVLASFLYIEDTRPVLVFDTPEHAKTFKNSFQGGAAETYDNKAHVFLSKPAGLMSVRAGKQGETAYVFHHNQQADDWAAKLNGVGVVYKDNAEMARTVYLGRAQS